MPRPDQLHLFEEIFRHAPVACLIIDDHDTIITANKQIEEIVGYPVSALKQKPLKEFITYHFENWQNIKKEVDKNGYFRRETVFKRNDAKELNVKYEIVKIVCKRIGAYYAFFVRDITTRSKTEMLYQHLFENTEDFIYTLDRDGQFISVNNAVIKTLGYSREELLGYAPEDLGIIAGDDLITADLEFFRLMRGESQETGRYVLTVCSKAGKKMTIEVHAVSIIDGAKVVGIQSIARDISARHEYEQRLVLLNKELEQMVAERTRELQEVVETKEQLMSDISHELRTPLTIIRLLLEDMIEQQPQALDDIDSITQEIDRLEQLVGDLSLISRPRGVDDLFVLTKKVNISDVMRETIVRLAPLWNDKKIVIHEHYDDIDIMSDKELSSRLCMNLLTNAIKYSNNRGEIIVRIMYKDSTAVMEVQDFGIGIPKEKQQRIFERFYRADNARDRFSGGIGLGLSIVKWIVEKHKGTIEVKSDVDKGSLFRVIFPHVVLSDLKKTNRSTA